jgi:tryptophan synthase alpha chain
MNRIDQKFKQCGLKKAFIAYITAGDPDIAITEQLVYALEEAGVSMINSVFRFPILWPTARPSGCFPANLPQQSKSLNDILAMVSRIRRRCEIPIALMTYYNRCFTWAMPSLPRPLSKRESMASSSDLPPEEAGDLRKRIKADFSTIFGSDDHG